jgi:hypothetical protein
MKTVILNGLKHGRLTHLTVLPLPVLQKKELTERKNLVAILKEHRFFLVKMKPHTSLVHITTRFKDHKAAESSQSTIFLFKYKLQKSIMDKLLKNMGLLTTSEMAY